MAESETEIFCDLNQKNLKRKSYKGARVSLKSVLNSEKHEDILRIPDYRRADIGFSAILKSANKNITSKWLNKFNSIWVSLEVFNILDINNTVSYLWVADITGREYAVPNFLTKRQLNTKIIFSF